jgi:hypothetical protein
MAIKWGTCAGTKSNQKLSYNIIQSKLKYVFRRNIKTKIQAELLLSQNSSYSGAILKQKIKLKYYQAKNQAKISPNPKSITCAGML